MQTALVTGASRGIGLELTKRLLAAGYHVLATCRQPGEAKALNGLAAKPNLEIRSLDVTSDESTDRMVSEIGGRPIDVLVNNAGTMGDPSQTVDDMNYDAWLAAFAVNTMAPFRITLALRDNLAKAERPRVVTLSSQVGSLNRQSKGAFAHRSSKAAVNKVMQVLALELRGQGIIVCPFHPGWVRTDMGGPVADISAAESATGLVALIESLTMEHSGRFWTWEGKEHPW